MNMLYFCSESAMGMMGLGLILGILVGLLIGRLLWGKNSYGLEGRRNCSTTHLKKEDADKDQLNSEEPIKVLDGALKLFRLVWIDQTANKSSLMRKVVEYLPAEKMLSELFYNECEKDEDSTNKNPSFSLSNSINMKRKSHTSSGEMKELFRLIQKYSVNTSHKYFFNQLFGATDPIALASELISLSVNTSAYTFETAPIFTMIEKEVISSVASIVYGKQSSINCDGIMIPGGSISNLTALHIARHNCMSKSSYGERFYEEQSKSDNYEEKKARDIEPSFASNWGNLESQLVAFISEEAHYSFTKAAAVIGLKKENIIKVPTLSNGVMDTKHLDTAIHAARAQYKYPFFVAATAGSTVRGSFDSIKDITSICEQSGGGIWIHVDGAWGGPAIFSHRKEIRDLMKGIEKADSFTFNPHKMLGAPQQTTVFVSRHKNILKRSNSLQAKYLFDNRKNGANFDIGDALFTCGRRTDAVKFWAMLKFYGLSSLGKQVDKKADSLKDFVSRIKQHDNFMLACDPWPFNVNFFFLPKRIKRMLEKEQIPLNINNPILPDYISNELTNTTVKLKLLLHEAGEMLIPYQPISNQKAYYFRLVLAGQKEFQTSDIQHILSVMEKYGSDL